MSHLELLVLYINFKNFPKTTKIYIFQLESDVFSVHLNNIYRGIVRTDLEMCSTKKCSEKKQAITQNSQELFSCEHTDLVATQECTHPMNYFSVKDCRCVKFGKVAGRVGGCLDCAPIFTIIFSLLW